MLEIWHPITSRPSPLTPGSCAACRFASGMKAGSSVPLPFSQAESAARQQAYARSREQWVMRLAARARAAMPASLL